MDDTTRAHRLLSLMKSVQTNARMVEREVVFNDDLVMAEGHAILLAQQSAELRDTISHQIKAREGAPS